MDHESFIILPFHVFEETLPPLTMVYGEVAMITLLILIMRIVKKMVIVSMERESNNQSNFLLPAILTILLLLYSIKHT